jgi:hypothetical protein
MNEKELRKYLIADIKQCREMEEKFEDVEHIYWHFFGQRMMAQKILMFIGGIDEIK